MMFSVKIGNGITKRHKQRFCEQNKSEAGTNYPTLRLISKT